MQPQNTKARKSGGTMRRVSGWWNTPAVRKDFAEMPIRKLCAEYGISPSYVSILRKKMRETEFAPEVAETPGSKLRAIREAQGMTQAEFCKVLGVSLPTLWRWETGNGRIPKTARKFIAEKYGKILD